MLKGVFSEAKILFLSHVNETGGAEKSLLELIAGLDRRQFKAVLAGPPGGRLAMAADSCGCDYVGIPIRRLSRSWRPDKMWQTVMGLKTCMPALRRVIAEQAPAIIHANNDTAMLYAALACRARPDIRLVWHCRDIVPLRFLGPRLYRRAQAVIAISTAVRRHLQQYADYPPTKLHTIPNGINFNNLTEQGARKFVRGELGIHGDTLLIATIGQLVPWKQQDLFLEAAALIATVKPQARFLVVGDDLFNDHPGYRQHLESLAGKPPLDGKVIFTGYRPDMVPIIEALDILVHPAAEEPFGRAVVEAMSLHKPVVAVDGGGPSEIIHSGQDGVLVPPNEPRALADAVLNLAGNPDLARRLGAAAGTQVRRAFNLPDYMRLIENIYAELLRS